jgi:hypothetical protein
MTNEYDSIAKEYRILLLRDALTDIAKLATQSIDTEHGGKILRDIEVLARWALAETKR